MVEGMGLRKNLNEDAGWNLFRAGAKGKTILVSSNESADKPTNRSDRQRKSVRIAGIPRAGIPRAVFEKLWILENWITPNEESR